jgi:uncharacterized protein YdbL (DUF1318 family)
MKGLFKRKLVLILMVVALVTAIVIPMSVSAASTATVVITASGTYVAITNSQASWAIGQVATSATNTWGSATNYSTISNTGNVSVSIFLTGNNLIGSTDTWTLGAAAGDGTYVLKDNMATASTFNQAITTGGVTAKTGVAAAGTAVWSMIFIGPTSFTGYGGNTLTATLTISASQ